MPIESYVPVLMFAIVFGLSMDYEVFLLSRIKEAWDSREDNTLAVADGLSRTARVITCAALIMASVFIAFTLSSNVVVKMLAVGLSVERAGGRDDRAADTGTRVDDAVRRARTGGCPHGSTGCCRTSTPRARSRHPCRRPPLRSRPAPEPTSNARRRTLATRVLSERV